MDWNVVVTVREHGFKKARDFLYEFGKVGNTDFFNVMVLKVDDLQQFMAEVSTAISINMSIMDAIARIMPVTHTFVFQSPSEFDEKAQAIIEEWTPMLAGRCFHVRMHRRGFKGRLSSQQEESALDKYVINSLSQQGRPPAKIDFADPDYIIAVESVGQAAGLSIWSRELRQRYPFLKLD